MLGSLKSIVHFSLGATAANIDWKSQFLTAVGHFSQKRKV